MHKQCTCFLRLSPKGSVQRGGGGGIPPLYQSLNALDIMVSKFYYTDKFGGWISLACCCAQVSGVGRFSQDGEEEWGVGGGDGCSQLLCGAQC